MIPLQSRSLLLLVLLMLNPLVADAQGSEKQKFTLIETYLEKGNFDAADSVITFLVDNHKSNNQYDSLAPLIYYVGWTKHAKGQTDQGIQSAESLITYLKSNIENPGILWDAYMELGQFYELIGNPSLAYEKNKEALYYALKTPSATGEDIGKIESNLGIYANRFGNLALSRTHLRKALKSYSSYPKTSFDNYFNCNNNMGTVMWFSSKADSALYYYTEALEYLKKMSPTPHNKYYRRALVQNNMSILLDTQGKKTAALQMMRDVIKNLDQYLQAEIDNAKRQKATEFKFQAIDNLAGGYKSLGDYTKTLELLKYSYRQKQKHFGSESPEIFKSLILIGQAELALQNHETASVFLDKGLTILNKTPNKNLFWNADAHLSKAIIKEEQGKPIEAALFYEKSEMLYEKAFQGEYDNMYLDFLTKESLFYAKTGNAVKAKEKALKGYHYIIQNQGEHTLLAFHQILNLAAVHYELGEFKEALSYSNQGISILNKTRAKSSFFIDSVHIENNKPYAILIKARSQYQLRANKDQVFLEDILKQLDTAIFLLERHKAIFSSQENLSALISENKEVFDFSKKIALELYFITQDDKFLDRAMGLHESSLYNRIRSRLNAKETIRFANIPDSVFVTEKGIRQAMEDALKKAGDDTDDNMHAFFKATAQWNGFLQRLKKDYPKYYKMRYATIAKSVDHVQDHLPEEIAVVRYFFVEKQLYALLLSKHKEALYKLDYNAADGLIAELNNNQASFNKTALVIQQLYEQLWAPFADHIATEKVIIIPDGELFNLSFEMLSPVKITAFTDLAKSSLLAKYSISYNYSLLLLKEEGTLPTFDEPFVAFVPGFSEEIKEAYKNTIADSLAIDFAYLRLLPQPFTSDLVNHLVDRFGGKVFVYDQSTKRNFQTEAGNQKVLHIGTHAASNNLNPELSRLIFAKDLDRQEDEESNVLYAYEIYNYDLTANLTVLTACETGKPGYQAGEGMISLAHAFNYAGSQSMLTSLWEVDEQASTIIANYFYGYLTEGYAKDEALQQAKLAYLATAEGRTVAPQYWAGLVIMGDTSPIYLEEKGRWEFWTLGGFLGLAFIAAIFYKRRFL